MSGKKPWMGSRILLAFGGLRVSPSGPRNMEMAGADGLLASGESGCGILLAEMSETRTLGSVQPLSLLFAIRISVRR